MGDPPSPGGSTKLGSVGRWDPPSHVPKKKPGVAEETLTVTVDKALPTQEGEVRPVVFDVGDRRCEMNCGQVKPIINNQSKVQCVYVEVDPSMKEFPTRLLLQRASRGHGRRVVAVAWGPASRRRGGVARGGEGWRGVVVG